LQEKTEDFLGKEYYIIYKYIIYFLKGFGEEKSTGGNKKNAPAEVAHTGQCGAKSDRNPLAELAGTGQCGAGIGKSRIQSGRIRRRKSRMTSGRKDDVNADNIRRKYWKKMSLARNL